MGTIDQFREKVQQKLRENPLLAWAQEIPPQEMEELRQKHCPKSRKRVWSAEVMIWFWLTSGLYRERSFRAVISELWVPLCVEIPELKEMRVRPERLTEGRARIPAAMLKEIRERLGQKGAQEGRGMHASLWHGRRVMWIDGSTLAMPDEPELREYFGRSRTHSGACGCPLARIVNIGVAGTRILTASAYGPYRTSELELARSAVVEGIQAGDVVLGDRLFASAELIWGIQKRGGDVVMRKHAQLKVSKHRRKKIGEHDWIIELEIDRRIRRLNPALPETIRVRVCRVIQGHGKSRQELWIETTLLDPHEFPPEELAGVYWTRWGVETSYAEIKVEPHLDFLRSKNVQGVEREIEAHLAAYNYIRLQILRAAKGAGIDPAEISFTEAVRVIVKCGQLLRICASKRDCQDLLGIMLGQMAQARIPLRKGRHEPRARKRPPKKFPRWKGSRAVWRMKNGFAA